MARYFNYLMYYKSPLNEVSRICFPINLATKRYSILYSRGIHKSACQNSHENEDKRIKDRIPRQRVFKQNPTAIDNALKGLLSTIQAGNIDNAIKIFEKLHQENDFRGSDVAYLTLIDCLVKTNRVDDAKSIISKFGNNEIKFQSTKDADILLCSIFDSPMNSTDDYKWFVNNLVLKRKYVNRKVLQIIMKNVLVKHDNLNLALEFFDQFARQFRTTPLLGTLTCNLINSNDADSLEQILTISSKVHGQVNSFYDMALAFTKCGRIDQAKKIFRSLEASNSVEKLEGFIENAKLRRQIKDLQNLIAATENYAPKECRERAFTALLELYAYENDSNEAITDVISTMDKENIVPNGDCINKITALLKRYAKNIEIPNSWLQRQRSNEHDSEALIQSYLKENNIEEANRVWYDCLRAEKSLPRNVIRFCLSKNAENGNFNIFKDLTSKIDEHTKTQLNFHEFECKAYTVTGKSNEYLDMIRDDITKNSDNPKQLQVRFPPAIIDMIAMSPDIYEDYVKLAEDFAGKGIIKPICLAWIYNFIHDRNSADNDTIWNKYLYCHPTIVCNQVAKILFKRKEIEKLRQYLNFKNVQKPLILSAELGKAYSCLFEGLLYKGDNDAIIDELQKSLLFLSVKDFRPNTLNKIKFGSPELSERFWSVINNSPKVIEK